MRGTWYVVPTAFRDDGDLDLDSQAALAEAAVRWGAGGLTVLGVMGESTALDDRERGAVLDAVMAGAAGRVPVTVGCSAAAQRLVRRRVDEAAAAGAAAVMVSAPPLHRDAGSLPGFFAEIAAASPLPLVIQDEPAATGVTLPTSVLLAIVESTGARVVKLEDPPTPPKIGRILAADPELTVFGGLGGVSALAELRSGSCGTMTGFAFPEVLARVYESHSGGEADVAAGVFDAYLPLIQFEAQPGIGLGIRKEILRRRGVIAANHVRVPAGRISPATADELSSVLRRVGVVPSPDPLPVRNEPYR